MLNNIRVRFAPSPTGALHIGGVRTALFNYLFAKKHGGTFVLRIEDTDQSRYVANAEKYIINSLNWCNIPFDEGPGKNEKFGPYRQSQRKELYKKYANELIAKKRAYYAFDTSEELEKKRKEYDTNNKEPFVYNWKNRKGGTLVNSLVLTEQEVKKRIDSGEKYVIRFKTPQDQTLLMEDEIRGTIKVDTNILDDKILFKSDGMPTYHLANIVDDHLMKISHVIRGEEWLPSMALHILLYKAFGWEAPKFAHLPLILKPVGKGKLSKRDGDKLGFPVFPLEYKNEETGDVSRGYKEDGYFADAFINMLALLGWNPGTEQEIFSIKELINEFDLARVSKSGAKFSLDKTKWFNQQYLQKKTNETLAKLFIPILEEKLTEAENNRNSKVKAFNFNKDNDKDYAKKVISLIKERAIFITDFWDLSSFFFVNPAQYDEKAIRKIWKQETSNLMKELAEIISKTDSFVAKNIQNNIKNWIKTKQIGFGKVMQPLRLSLVGKLAGPDLFEIIEMIGKETTIKRIEKSTYKFGQELK